MISCFHTTGCEPYSLTTDEYGIFNVRTNLGACCTHEGGQAQTSMHKSWLWGIEKLFPSLTHQGIETRVFGFAFQLSNHWGTPPPPPPCVVVVYYWRSSSMREGLQNKWVKPYKCFQSQRHRARVCLNELLCFLRCAGVKLSASFSPTPCAVNMHILAWKVFMRNINYHSFTSIIIHSFTEGKNPTG